MAIQRLPATHALRIFPAPGRLFSYGQRPPEVFRLAADYVSKIIKDARPDDLPVEQPTKYEFVINMKTAKALRLAIPPAILLRADEVIE